MKKIFLALTLIFIFLKSFSQEPASPSLSKEDYLKKSQQQKKTAWILLATGTAMAVGGIIVFNNTFSLESNSTTDIAAFVALAGIVTDLVSIGFFVGSSNSKQRAARIAISNQHISFPQQNAFALKTQPALTLKIAL